MARLHVPSYFDKVFKQPDFIWKDGLCDVDALHASTSHLAARFAQLMPSSAPAAEQSVASPEKPIMQVTLPPGSRSDVTPSRSAIIPLKSDVWNGVEPINYHAQIQVGTAPHPFFVDLDTGSSLLWLQAQLALSDPQVPDQTMYAPSASSTSTNLNNQAEAKYGDGATVTVSLFTDAVSAGSLTAPSQRLGAASTSDINDAFRSKASNGMLGLGFPIDDSSLVPQKFENLVQTLKSAGRLKYASLSIIGPRNDPKAAAQIDKNKTMQPRGYFVIGSVDPSFYTGSISWCPQLKVDRWVVSLDAVLINGEVAFTNQKALVDTGTAYIVASPSNYAATMAKMKGSPIPKKQGMYFTYAKESLKSVSFVFGGRKINLHPQDFSLGRIEVKGQEIVNGVKTEVTTVCSSIIRLPDDNWPFGQDMWVIGGIFMDNVVTVFDFGGRQVGFADISEEDLEKDQGLEKPA